MGPPEPLLVPAERPTALTGTAVRVATEIRNNRELGRYEIAIDGELSDIVHLHGRTGCIAA